MTIYVGRYEHNLDGKRLHLPAEFDIEVGSKVYAIRARGGILCYDEDVFGSMALKLAPERFSEYVRLNVEAHKRLNFNGMATGLLKRVVVDGRGDHFSVRRAEGLIEGISYQLAQKLKRK